MIKTVLYHGTADPREINEFWPNSHFGSKVASVDAVAAKWIDDEEVDGQQSLPEILTIDPNPCRRSIEVELTYDTESCLLTDEDWGNPNAVALSNLLRKIPGFEDSFTPIYEMMFKRNRELRSSEEISRANRAAALREYGIPIISSKLEARGIKLIKYRNIVEGKSEQGEYEHSYCVFDPKLIHVRNSFPIGDDDFCNGIRRLLEIKYPTKNFHIAPRS
jgi:hypothetical protein